MRYLNLPRPERTDESIPATPTETTLAFHTLGSEASSSATDDPVPEETTPYQASALDPPSRNEENLTSDQPSLEETASLQEPASLEEPSSLEAPSSLKEASSLTETEEDTQPTKNWYDTLSFQQGSNFSSKFSSRFLPPQSPLSTLASRSFKEVLPR